MFSQMALAKGYDTVDIGEEVPIRKTRVISVIAKLPLCDLLKHDILPKESPKLKWSCGVYAKRPTRGNAIRPFFAQLRLMSRVRVNLLASEAVLQSVVPFTLAIFSEFRVPPPPLACFLASIRMQRGRGWFMLSSSRSDLTSVQEGDVDHRVLEAYAVKVVIYFVRF